MTRYARIERSQLCTLLEQTGPDHPTLCTGWSAYDLAAHLVLRERRADAAPGIAIRALAGHTAAVQREFKATHTYQQLIDMLRDGPPWWWPLSLPVLDEAVNTVELFVHHEDVRRASPGWEPRTLDDGMEDLLWDRLRRIARLFFRRSPVGVRLRRAATGQTVIGHTGEPAVGLTGPASELIMYAFNRKDHARVVEDGDAQLVARLRSTRLGA